MKILKYLFNWFSNENNKITSLTKPAHSNQIDREAYYKAQAQKNQKPKRPDCSKASNNQRLTL